MINDKTSLINVESTIQGDRVAMIIEDSAMAHIMDVLTNLYADPEYAVLREYTTNGLDSHIEAGQTRPVEVNLPTDLSPVLRIRDYGVGMDGDDIKGMYSRYGASTKRETNSQVGMLGLGSKSGLAYAAQFTLIGIKDGFKIVVAISRDDDGSGSMTILDYQPTDEANGVEVVIPAKKENRFAEKAATFFSYWEPGTVLVNGKQPEPIEGMKVTDDLLLVTGGTDKIVMGNVAYPVEWPNLDLPYGLVARVPIGSVNFAPNREALRDTHTTRETVAAVEKEFLDNITAAVQRLIDEKKTPIEAMRLANEWRSQLPESMLPGSMAFGGKDIPKRFEFGEGDKQVLITNRWSSKLSQHNHYKSLNAETVAASLMVTDYDRDTFTPAQKKKLNKYAEDNSIEGIEHYCLLKVTHKEALAWVDPSMVIDWATIEAIKLPRSPRQINNGNDGRLKGSYDAYADGRFHYEVPADDINTKKPLFYIVKLPKEGAGYYAYDPNPDISGIYKLMTARRKDCTLVVLSKNRVEKFKRTFPMAKDVKAEMVKIFNRVAAKVTSPEVTARKIRDDHGSVSRLLKEMDETKVDDPAVLDAIKMVQGTDTYKDKLSDFRPFMGWMNVRNPDVKADKFVDPMTSYPLVSDFYTLRSNPDHCYTYMNAIYAAAQSSKENN